MLRIHKKDWSEQEATEGRFLNIAFNQVEAMQGSRQVFVLSSEGIGKPGTLVAAMCLREEICNKNSEITTILLPHYLKQLILRLRKQIGNQFVNSEDQFRSLLEYGYSLINKKYMEKNGYQ